MQITDFIVERTGLSVEALFGAGNPLVRISETGGEFTVDAWNVPGVTAPTPQELAEAWAMPEPAPSPPDVVTDLQFRLALNAEGLRDIAESYVAAAAWDVRDWWDRATHIRRDDARLNAAVVAIGKTDADRDALFTLAATL